MCIPTEIEYIFISADMILSMVSVEFNQVQIQPKLLLFNIRAHVQLGLNMGSSKFLSIKLEFT